MKKAILCALALSVFVSTKSGAAPLDSNSGLAKVSLIRLNRETKLSFQPISDQGFVLVAIRDCSLLIDGKSALLKAGDYQKIPGIQSLELSQSGPMPVPLVLIKVVSTIQPLTIETTTLARHQELVDASDRNTTLLIAIDPLRLRDVRDLADDEPWKSGPQKTIELQEGQTAWLLRGVHRLRNSGKTATRFVTVEW
ncbi:MAG TPA: hypothetical protein VNY78_00575 [Edaphobacter sp.]|nr:hypothetical protein [Edaphobacter sp.]